MTTDQQAPDRQTPDRQASDRKALIRQAAATIRAANSILLACHIRPDADALGSLLALSLGLRRLGKEVQAVSADGVPELYRFLPAWETIRTAAAGSPDLGIGMDADGSARLGPSEAAVLACPTVIDIDHHTGPHPYGHIRLVDPTAAATGELVFELLQELNVPLDLEIAKCLMAAVLTDTGSFRYANVSGNTFRIGAALVEAGAHPGPIHEAVYGHRTYEASRLLGRLLTRIERSADGRLVWSVITQADSAELVQSGEDTEGFVDQLRMVTGSEVAIFFREEDSGDVRCSLRSRGRANVAKVAQQFGGGGHIPAAGCTLPGPVPQAVAALVTAAQAAIAAADGAPA